MVIRYRLGTRMLFTDHADLPIRAIGVIRGFPVARRICRDATDRQKIASQRQQSASHVATVGANENIYS
jgi:hypothetical protein